MAWRLLPLLFVCCAALPSTADDVEQLQERSIKAAVAKVGPCVVQIETSGGTDVVGGAQIRKGIGPTTGLTVAPDGYIVTSSFNFANRPTAIFVLVPGRAERHIAKVVATDQTRMLTLLKIEANNLPVPVAVPKKDFRVGQTSIAMGRTLSNLDQAPTVAVGIISALGRIWGKAIQTDAKVSPINYGGPLVDLQGRVLGLLVPASPRGQDETAGVEWYDAGIGFAIPLEDINTVLPKLRAGENLKRGVLGLRFKSSDIYGGSPEIDSVSPDFSAAKAGVQPGDIISAINGEAIERQNQLMHVLGSKYAGDLVSLKVRRGKDEVAFKDLQLLVEATAHVHSFLGILPVRDDPEAGEEVRYVFPKSPADAAGIKPGDRIESLVMGEAKPRPIAGPGDLTSVLNRLPPGTELKLGVKRKQAAERDTISIRLGVMTETIPGELPEPASRKKALEVLQPGEKKAALDKKNLDKKDAEKKDEDKKDEDKKDAEKKDEDKKDAEKKAEKPKVETGLQKRRTAAGDRDYWVALPENYDPNIAHAVVVWLHPRGKGDERDIELLTEAWSDLCSEKHLIMVCPRAESETGWLASEVEAVLAIIAEVANQYTVDRQRIVAHGMGHGGQFALYLGLNAREVLRGVATVGSALTSAVKDNVADQRLSFFLVAGSTDPLRGAITESRDKLVEQKFPVVYREIAGASGVYLDAETLGELGRWIDSLDRQ